MDIKFGTDGWRAVIGDQFTFANLRLVCQAIADHLHELGKKDVVVGFDQRFLSLEFADCVASVMTGNGIRVYLPSKAIPTAVAAFTSVDKGLGGALMLTASHNPPRYHGLKYIPSFGGPAMPEETDRIAERVADLQQESKIKTLSKSEAVRQGLIVEIDPQPRYLEHLYQLIDKETISRMSPRVVVDPMYGAGVGYLESFFSSLGVQVEVFHNRRDPLFGGGIPDPTPRYLGKLQESVVEKQADIGLALDGDADRMAAIASDGTYFNANRILPVLLNHLISSRGWKGAVARTIATTHLVDRIADANGLKLIETPVGFKYIGRALREEDAFLGGEESGGISIRGHVPEKDGILASLLLVEAMAAAGSSLKKMEADIQDKFGPLVSNRLDITCTERGKREVLQAMEHWHHDEILGEKVEEVNRIDGLKIVLKSGRWCLIRPSGTESLFRIYAEGAEQDEVKSLQKEICNQLHLPYLPPEH